MSDAASMHDFNAKIIEEFRANGGKVGGPFEGAPMVLLTHTGAKSGRTHTTPLVHGTDGDRIFIVASKGGAPTDPQWYRNLVAHPAATVEVGDERYDVTAEVADEPLRRELFDRMAEAMPGFRDYEKATDRVIPVVVLTRR